MAESFEAFVRERFPKEQWPIVERLRALVSDCVPWLAEAVSYDMPVWRGMEIVAYLVSSKREVTFGFPQGVRFDDRHGLLRGTAKWARHVKLRGIEAVNDEALCDYVRQAAALDAERGP